MNSIPPLAFTWTDEGVMVPRHPEVADRHFVVGDRYTLAVHENRSTASHNHYMAAIKEAHDNLPESVAERLPTPEHLRKYALIKAGYRDERSIACASKAEAQRVASFTKPMDDYAVIIVDEATVTCYTAKSQSYRAMGKQLFGESKQRVLDEIAKLVGVTANELRANVGRAA